jgi:integrase
LKRIEDAAVQLVQAIRSAVNATALNTVSDAAGFSVTDLVTEFLISKAKSQRSIRYLSLLVKQCRAFTRGREDTPAIAVTARDIEQWLYSQAWADKTRHGALVTVRNLFEFALERNYVVNNPGRAVPLPSIIKEAAGIHSPDQVRTVLKKCKDPSTLRYLAIRYFAGLRGSEAEALTEREIFLKQGFIEVTAEKAKCRQRRLVTIQPNLAEWLTRTKRRGGRLPLRAVNNRFSLAVKDSGVPWPQNVTRHSFVTYHLAAFGSAAKTALEAGHSEEMLFRNYRELKTLDGDLITPRIAKEFWKIVPVR